MIAWFVIRSTLSAPVLDYEDLMAESNFTIIQMLMGFGKVLLGLWGSERAESPPARR
jgi:hypothetical protein